MGKTEMAVNLAGQLGLRLDRLDLLEKELQRYAKDVHRQAIVFKAVKEGHTIFEGTYGYNTKSGGLHMDTIFPVASITKPVISGLIMALQEDGKIDIAEPVWKYLPEFDTPGWDKICVWHLMTHSSGLLDDELEKYVDEYVKNELKLEIPSEDSSPEEWESFQKKVQVKMNIEPGTFGSKGDETMQIIPGHKPSKPPRKEMVYCNHNFIILKYIIDAVSGRPIDEIASERLFKPLKMVDTAFVQPKEKWGRIIGREPDAVGAGWYNREEQYVSEHGAGGLKTTVNDMIRFGQMILNEGELDGVRVLSKASVREYVRDHNQGMECEGGSEFAAWGLGWNLRTTKMDTCGVTRSARCLEHTGFSGTKIQIDPEWNLVYACFGVETLLFTEKEFFNINPPVCNILYSAFEK